MNSLQDVFVKMYEGLLDIDSIDKDMSKDTNLEFIKFLSNTWKDIKWEPIPKGLSRIGLWALDYNKAKSALQVTCSNISKLLRKYKITRKVARPKLYSSSPEENTTLISFFPDRVEFGVCNPSLNEAFIVQEGVPIYTGNKYTDFIQIEIGTDHKRYWIMTPGNNSTKSEWFELPGWCYTIIKDNIFQ